jgi:hypothetical protein
MEVWPVIAMKSTAKGSVILNVVKDLTGDPHKILHYVRMTGDYYN